jgi:uncharacterized protein (TIGR03066 family)
MKAISAFVLGVLVFASTGAAQDDNDKKIVGKWEITKAGGQAEKGSIIEFGKDGKLSGTIKFQGQDVTFSGKYKLAKDKLDLNLKVGDMEVDESLTVKKLTDDTMELEDKDKKVDELKKVKDKKDK